MFKKMIEQEKAWSKWRKWSYKNHHLDCHLGKYGPNHSDLMVLGLMPFFFDEKTNMIIRTYKYRDKIWVRIINNIEGSRYYNSRSKALIAACEKAFEIYNNQLKGK
jgi:hypothetical protein